ncbi:MAG: hypothetical protein Metus_0611 [Candidatus Methanosuratincola subterraneus]|uniref:Uncharacterized protein n=1 Tax=Methanosuratincola subterraneus TaxID=2593994 RepID=A0A3S3RCH6_METS7|nr:MAG: hypothetical protein Metus_0611 [Candidatus Methanosuratincola subterraneus]
MSMRLRECVFVIISLLLAFGMIAQPSFSVAGAFDPAGDQEGGSMQMRHEGRDMEVYYSIQAVLSFVNMFLSALLMGIYLDTYRRIRSEFSLSLVIVSLVLFSYALTSNPLLHSALGFGGFGLGPFAMIPELFSCAALLILVYISLK